MKTPKFKIWIDGDACPKMVKEIVFKASAKNGISTFLVANNYMKVPQVPTIRFVQVEKGADMADFYITEQVEKGDLVITADIPLAALIVEKGAIGIDPRGELYTEENVRERLSMRDFMHDLRASGVDTSGPPPLSNKDKEKFANVLNKILAQLLK